MICGNLLGQSRLTLVLVVENVRLRPSCSTGDESLEDLPFPSAMRVSNGYCTGTRILLRRGAKLTMYPIDPPIRERWLLDAGDFPEAIEIDGQVFTRAIRKQPYEGVIEQYRAAVPRDSAHLLVLEDGTYVIDHVDEYNPDMGAPLRHWVVDHPRGKATIVAGLGIAGVIGSALYGEAKKVDNKER